MVGTEDFRRNECVQPRGTLHQDMMGVSEHGVPTGS